MSAIAGIYYLDDRPVDGLDLERMVNSMAHRGPNGKGAWYDRSVALGHRILWTTPESLHEELPLLNNSGDLVITADARIDNRDELVAILGVDGRPRVEVSDSELILSAYEKWGTACPERLLGDFAFALWDRHRKLMFCARDHMGLKPFYYYRSSSAFVFASEIKALHCLPEVPRRLNETRVADFLLGVWEDTTITFYQEIQRLAPAHTMTVGPAGARARRYWSLDPMRQLRLRSDDEYAEAFREVFTEAVERRLRCAFPIASMLSGGLDSSSVTCVARDGLVRQGRARLKTFSALFEGYPECTDPPYLQAVLAMGGVEPNILRANDVGHFANLGRILHYQDEPFFCFNLHWMWKLLDIMRQQGIRVLIDGVQGDVTVSYSFIHLADLVRAGQWREVLENVVWLPRCFGYPRWNLIWEAILSPLAPEFIRQGWRFLRWRNRLGGWTFRFPMIDPDFARRVNLEERLQTLLGGWTVPAKTGREDQWRQLSAGDNVYYLEVLEKACAAFSLEYRPPFCDRRLMEFCLALPSEQKLSRGWTRMVVRRALGGILPEKVQWRRDKADGTAVLVHGMLAGEGEFLDRVVNRNGRALDTYVDRSALQRVFHRYVSRHTGPQPRPTTYMAGTEIYEVLGIWKAVVLDAWLGETGLVPNQSRANGETIREEGKPMQPDKEQEAKKSVTGAAVKKPYHPPMLTVHGSVEQITAAKASTKADTSGPATKA